MPKVSPLRRRLTRLGPRHSRRRQRSSVWPSCCRVCPYSPCRNYFGIRRNIVVCSQIILTVDIVVIPAPFLCLLRVIVSFFIVITVIIVITAVAITAGGNVAVAIVIVGRVFVAASPPPSAAGASFLRPPLFAESRPTLRLCGALLNNKSGKAFAPPKPRLISGHVVGSVKVIEPKRRHRS